MKAEELKGAKRTRKYENQVDEITRTVDDLKALVNHLIEDRYRNHHAPEHVKKLIEKLTEE